MPAARLIKAGTAGLAILLLGGSVALAAGSGGYHGKTSQKQSVSFRIAGQVVNSFTITIRDKCPNGHILIAHEHYPQMTIENGSFGGSFAPVGGHRGEQAKLTAKVAADKVSGKLVDASFSPREKRLCHGTANFTASHG